MRKLILMRHAHTKPSHPKGDKQRELDEAGLAAARRAGQELSTLGVDYALVSSAQRTRQTFAALGLDTAVEFHDALYAATPDIVLGRIAEVEDRVACLLVVGHAPAMPALTAQLTYASDARASDAVRCHFPTATYAVFDVHGPWAHLAPDLLDEAQVRPATLVRPGHQGT